MNNKFSHQDEQALIEVLQSGNLHMGSKVKEFEEAFAQYVGVKYAVAVSSATAGMHIALMATAIGPKEEVIVPPIAPVGGPNAVFYQGAVNIFADVDPNTGNVAPRDVTARINSSTKAVLLHHYGGNPCDLELILERAKEQGIPVIVDATHALGARYHSQSVATLGDMVVFSLGPGNHIYTGDGGIIATDSEEQIQWLRMFRDEGFVKDPRQLSKDEGPWYYEMQDLGYPYRMTELQAALALSQLRRLDQTIERRAEIATLYNEAFGQLEQVQIPVVTEGCHNAWGFYPLQLKNASLKDARRKLFVRLKTAGIDVNVEHYPVFLHPYYLWAGHPDICTLEGSRAPKAEEFYQQVLLLPISETMTDDQVKWVIDQFCQDMATLIK